MQEINDIYDLQSERHRQLPAGVIFTIFTPTYNRCEELVRLYESLKRLNTKDHNGGDITFEWLVVDDGSTDNTRSLFEKIVAEDLLPVAYIHKPNGGKHTAHNLGVAKASGELFLSIDSDDSLLPDALPTLYNPWRILSAEQRERLKGVTARAMDPTTGLIVGSPLPVDPLICSAQDSKFRYHVQGDLCGFNRTDILRQYPFPVTDEKLSFMPESIVWFEIGKKYNEFFIDQPILEVHLNSGNSIMRGVNSRRACSNYYLWRYEVNNLPLRYFRSAPNLMLKAYVGITMDGFRSGRSVGTILSECNKAGRRCLVALLMPAGWVLSKIKKN